jgi:hypothetical protein
VSMRDGRGPALLGSVSRRRRLMVNRRPTSTTPEPILQLQRQKTFGAASQRGRSCLKHCGRRQ